MNILITAGGTTEPIDSVRSITNTSTGKLGSLIADAYSGVDKISKIYYVCGKNSIFPHTEKAEVIFVDTVASLELTVKNIIENNTIDIIIHSMAVSDYRVKTVTSVPNVSKALHDKMDTLKDKTVVLEEFVAGLLQDSKTIINSDGKIRSNISDLILCMEQTPKVISLFQRIAPKAILVGFKLLDQVSVEELIATAYRVLQENRCNFVLANDLREITMDKHVGYLIDQNRNYLKCSTKEEIAKAIVKATLRL